jgi:Cu(I)/Ag(I) efflux system membrane protein CusA/SilA
LAKVVVAKGTPGIRTENGLLSAYIYVDIRDRDIGGYVAEAKKAVADQVKFPAGYYVTWSGQFENMEHAIEKMKVVIPVTLLSIFLLLYLNFRRITETLIVMLSVPFALVGGVWLMWAVELQPVGGRGGRLHCAGRGSGGDRRDHADLPGPRLGGR